jgi:YD repeat-containing protein
VDLQQQYTPPTVTGISAPQTQYSYNLDKQLLQIRRPDGQTIEFVYDEVKGRLDRIDLPNEESINYTYFEDTGNLKTIIAPDGGILKLYLRWFARVIRNLGKWAYHWHPDT